jgi:hypothetical protein
MNLEQFAGRDLSPAEARALALQALDNEELFDALVAQGAVEASLSSPALQTGLSAPVRRAPWVIAFCAVAAALLVGLFLWRASSGPVIHPSLAMGTARPVVLASNLIAGTPSNADFRGDGGITREPRPTGTVVAIEDGQVTINLGAIDGVEQGAKLGPIVITSVFRDHARGAIPPGAHVKVNESV